MTIGSKTRRARPGLESLEGRQLLNGAFPSLHQTVKNTPLTEPILRRFAYTAPGGAKVVIELFGAGNLYGTNVDPSDGSLNLRFSGTNQETGILSTVVGGTGVAPLRSVQSLNLPAGSLSGVGGTLINIVDLPGFDLIPGGRINLTPGVHVLTLNSTAADTQINLREVPQNTTVTTSTGSSSTTITNGTVSTGSTTTGTTVSGTTTTTSTPTSTTTTVLPASTTQNGQTLTYSYAPDGGQTLTGVSGQFVPGANVVLQNITPGSPNPQPGAPPAPPGVKIAIKNVNGPARASQALGDAQVYGYDPVAGALIRFDTVTGTQTQTIPLAGILPDPAVEAGVALSQVNGKLLVLVSDGSNVYAFNTADGTPAGEFSLSNLKAADDLADPLRLGTFDNQTVIADPTGGTNGLGAILPIDVAASLASADKQAQPVLDTSGDPIPAYSLTRNFGLAGGLSGVAGGDTLYAAGGGIFDPYQPNQFLLGLSALGFANVPTGVASFGEVSRSAVTGLNGMSILSNSTGATASSLNNALGSVDQDLALFTGQTTSSAGATVDTVTLINPVSGTEQSTITLDDSNALSSLSGSFRPSLAGAALVDVQGDTQSFKASSTQGLVFSGEGNVNLVQIKEASDTLILGYPFGHAAIPHRSDVTIISSTRSVGGRNGVTVVPKIKPTGPLFLPTP